MTSIRALILEDRPDDAQLMVRALQREGFTPDARIVDNGVAFETALAEGFDVILVDYTIPGYGGLAALAARNAHARDVPFIVVTGTIGDERAVECVRMGATDFVLKDRMGRLGPAVRRAIEERATARTASALQTEIARTSVDRELARWIVRELVKSRGNAHTELFEVGKHMAAQRPPANAKELAETYRRLGLGQLEIVEDSETQLVAEGDDLFERAPGAKTVTCFLTAGYLVGGRGNGERHAKGSEVACQSRGDPKCRFVIRG